MSSRADFSAALPLPREKLDSSYRARPRSERLTVSRLCASLLLIGGSLVLTAWVVDLQVIKSLSPQWTTMKVNTALSFVLSGVALWHLGASLAGSTARLAGLAAAISVLVIGLLTGVQFAFDIQLGIDELLLRQPATAADYMPDGRMSPATAAAFVLLGTAFLCQAPGNSGGNRMSLLLALVVGTVSLTTVIGYVYGAPALHPTWPTSTMALHTAVLFAVASIGILGAQADRSPLGILASEGTGSTIARRLLPLAIAVPVLIGWFTLHGERAGVYGLELGLMLLVVASVATFVLMIWVTATALNRADATQRDAIQAVANEAMRRRVLFEQARDGILIFDAARNIVEANTSFANMLGYSLDEVMKLRPWDWDAKYNTRELFFEAWPELPTTSGQLETEFRHKQGDIIDTAISYSSAELDGENYLYCICRDITSRKRNDRALHESQERFRRALANIPDVVVIYDRELRIRFINNATRAITGMRAADFIGRRDEDIFPPDVHQAYMPTLEKAFSSKRICKVDTKLTLPGDRLRALRITCVPLLDSQGEVREVLGITHDYTDRQKAEEKFRQSQSQYQELIEQAADGIFISDAEGKFVLVNSRCCELLGYSRDELLSMNGSETYLEEETDMTTRRLAKLSSGQDLRYERMVKRKDGSAFPAEVSVKMLEAGRMQVIFHDITSRRLQEQKIARLNRIHAVLSGINSTIVRTRKRRELLAEACRIAVTAGNFKIAWIGCFEQATGQMRMLAQSGLPISLDVSDRDTGKVVDLMPDGPARFSLQAKRAVYDNDITESVHLSSIRRMAIRLGSKSVISLPLIVEENLFGVLVLYAPDRNFFDEEELKLLKQLAGDISFALAFIAKEEKVDYLAYYDTLTGLPNRKLFFDAFKRQLDAAEKEGQKVVLQLLDIDRFRMINETYGRDDADKLIAAIAKRISVATGEQDTIARVGPDSFAVAISGVWQAARTAHALDDLNEQVFGRPFVLKGEELRVSATSGVAVFPGDGVDPYGLLSNAEAAQRNAEKQNIRFQFYSPDMNERVADSMRLENRLRLALEQDEILMWYQPKTSLQSGELTGFEALMRWRDRESGDMVQPGKFIPIMEQTGLILVAGRRALTKVVDDCCDWQQQQVSVPRVAINVSLMQLREDDFVASIMHAHEQTAIAGCALDLELTESVLMENVDSILPKLQTLHGLGVQIAVDDFGTGYSSLAYISRLPIHALKIDRSFVFGMTQDQNSLTIVRSTISLAHSLGLKVVAEGVETAEQAELLAELQCDEMQGYYLSQPVPPSDVPALIRKLGNGGPGRT